MRLVIIPEFKKLNYPVKFVVRVRPPKSGVKNERWRRKRKTNEMKQGDIPQPVSRTTARLCTTAVTCFSLAGTEHF